MKDIPIQATIHVEEFPRKLNGEGYEINQVMENMSIVFAWQGVPRSIQFDSRLASEIRLNYKAVDPKLIETITTVVNGETLKEPIVVKAEEEKAETDG